MRFLQIALVTVLALLSLAAGAAKLLAAPGETALVADAGLSSAWLWPHGALQVIAPVLVAFAKLRRVGLAGIAIGFALSCLVIFLAGYPAFGAFSLIPVALAGWALHIEGRQP
ncbi:hypothetical protein [Qipengyuania nanhaisediminis]|uniref:hypothetical protein n=1 Tax=Qipengyuania nanhaisediminis TaxID=604088 RepID=UPI0038B29ED2